ncbi:hypothetical protein SteCoe_10156 [Stentor coeruleus]|uniref:Uncharacterized protein n=1 Tax=Stentor coeruleus TaxID=5963 RepID=A0A1R2CG52_9CILI|nr:hypothetical protein SteCoe_10156 [Stentor coeruleus]
MGCCETRPKLMTPADLAGLSSLTIEESKIKPITRPSFALLVEQKRWSDIVKLIGNSDPIFEEDKFLPLTPQPSTVGCMAIAVLSEASKDPINKIHFYIKNVLSMLVLNLTSDDIILKHYSYDLLYSCTDNFTESIMHELISYGFFESLSEIYNKNTMIFAHKVFKNRERAQRMFLKHKGYEVVISCLSKYKEDSGMIFVAVGDLLVDNKRNLSEYNCKHFFTQDFLKALSEFQGEECENVRMIYEEYLNRFV